MAMKGNDISTLYYSQNNLDNTFKQVSEEIMRRTNKDISHNSAYRTTFNKMAEITYDRCPPLDKNLTTINTQLVDKSVSYFHNKIFEKNVNKPTEKQTNNKTRDEILSKVSSLASASNTDTSYGFTMLKENEDITNNYNEYLSKRDNLSDGNTNSYLPQPMNPSASYVKKEVFTKGSQNNDMYEGQFKRIADQTPQNNVTQQSKNEKPDFSIKPFNLSDDMTESLFGSENVDTPLYQNIEKLQKMENTNPMTMLEDYQKQRNQQIQAQAEAQSKKQEQNKLENNIYSERRPNNTNAQTNIEQTIVNPLDLSNLGSELTQRFIEKIEKNIVNNNKAQPTNDINLAQMQEALIKLQRDTQPKYMEKVHYINVNSVDREWEKHAESRFQFQVKFNQSNTFTGAGISQLYRNVVSVELVSAILPMDTNIIPFDTRLYNGLMKYPYLLLRIDELDSVFRGTNNWVDRAFSTLLFDKVFFSSILSTEYTTGTSSIVNSVPKQGFTNEYNRGFLKYNPAYFEKKKFYNNPLASLNRMSITITDPRGNFINTQTDVLDLSNIVYTSNLNVIGNALELDASNCFPYSTQSNFKMIGIETTTYFSNRLFRIGDRILIRNYATDVTLGGNNAIFNSFINRPEGHTIINLELEDNGNANTNNRGFLNKLFISPPGTMNAINKTVDPATYYDNTTLNFTGAVFGTLINIDLQTHLLFRIVTRDPDTSNTLQPINVY
jgi:hypothetical protein